MTSLDEKNLLNDRYNVYEHARPYSRRVDRDELWFFDSADCRSVLESPDLSSQRPGLASRVEQAGFPFLGEFFRQWLMYTDGSEHVRRRTAVVRALRQIGLDAAVEYPTISIGTEFDLIEDFCEPYVWHILPQLLGLTTEEIGFWKPRVAPLVALPGSENLQAEVMRLAEVGLRELHEFLLTRPCRLLSILKQDMGQTVGIATIINMAINVIGDGVHPTIAGLGSEIFLRLASKSVSDSDLPDFVFHREAPFQFAARVASRPTNIREISIDAGQRVVACLAAANRAQAAASPFERPMTFGHGRHACIGRAYAEKCIQSGLEMFAELTGGKARSANQPRWTQSIGYRMIETLKVQVATE